MWHHIQKIMHIFQSRPMPPSIWHSTSTGPHGLHLETVDPKSSFPCPKLVGVHAFCEDEQGPRGWHIRLNDRVCRTGRVPFYLLLIELYQKATAIPLVARLLSEGKMERINRKKTNLLNGKLLQVWSDYKDGQISTSQLFRACSGFYGPSRWSVVWLNLYNMWTVLWCDHDVFVCVCLCFCC